jgi:alpha-amylase/alpha-mannosidase (GH57 family)
MTDSPLSIAFLWHMHQPFYREPLTGLYRLPWVRLHGTKDYLDMVEIQSGFPAIKQTFNFTPSLLEQILDYTENNARDRYLELSLKKASELSEEDKVFLLENFFLANWDTMIKPFPRYSDILSKRGVHLIRSDLARLARYFSVQDFLDLQLLFNLCWIDPLFRQNDPDLRMLVEKGRDFTEEDKQFVIEKQLSILKQIIPRYKELAQNGQIELSCSPFYHPILPLLCDTNVARVALPGIDLPQQRFSYPADAEKQIVAGIDYFEKIFGYRPRGMWPSEGSVSEEVVKIAAHAGIQWLATDEDILAISTGKQLRDSSRNLLDPGTLYSPHTFGNVSIIFRDHLLSDLIGFTYAKWDPMSAANDLIRKLEGIAKSIPKDKPHLVSIILDGENAWEYYSNDGYDFLKYLYEGLSTNKRLQTVTVSEFLDTHDKGSPLKTLHPGSWIYANYAVWIGHEEDNTAWDYLSETRKELELFQSMHPEKDLPEAWKSLYIAEGSDWNWWYGDDHTTETQKDFDELFRMNLMNVYREIGKEIPPFLFVPVLREDRSIAPTVAIRGFIDPKIDGTVTSYYEWYQGAQMDIRKSGGSMHKAESLLSSIYYGFNKETLFLRADPVMPLNELPEEISFSVDFVKPSVMKIIVSIRPALAASLHEKTNGSWEKVKDIPDAAFGDILEIGIPFIDLNARENDVIDFSICITKKGEEIERCPWRGHITLTVPSPDFEAMLWY